MSVDPELEARIERLETKLRELSSRLEALEPPRATGPPQAAPEPVQPSLIAESDSPNVIGLIGISILILGGAYVLRALTESAILPQIGGAILGLAYAGVWLWNADRLARQRRTRSALFQAVTAALIAFPLLWEVTARFRIVPPLAGSAIVGVLALAFLWIAARSGLQTLVWTGSLAAIAAAFAIGPSPGMLVAISAVGAVTLWIAYPRSWEFVAWPAALAANVMALILIVTRPAGTTAALIAFSILWIAPAVRGAASRDILTEVQPTFALLAGAGGATLLLMPSAASASLVWAAAGLASAEMARRTALRVIAVQSALWILAASVASGLLLATGVAFIGDASSVELPLPALVTGLLAFGGYLRLDTQRPERVILLSVVLGMAFTGAVAVLGREVANLALLRTAILAIAASLLALSGWLTGSAEASILARAALVAGGVKLLIEDLRVERAAILVVSFALYGFALLIVSRSGRGVRTRDSAHPA